jgi:hypothetical protein
MSGELHGLARRLDRISDQHRWSRDFTLNTLQSALIEVIASFPVYRTYIRAGTREVGDSDRCHIRSAICTARRRNPAVSRTIFEFIESVLLLEDPPSLTPGSGAERREFMQRFQQLTSPVMARGMAANVNFFPFHQTSRPRAVIKVHLFCPTFKAKERDASVPVGTCAPLSLRIQLTNVRTLFPYNQANPASAGVEVTSGPRMHRRNRGRNPRDIDPQSSQIRSPYNSEIAPDHRSYAFSHHRYRSLPRRCIPD